MSRILVKLRDYLALAGLVLTLSTCSGCLEDVSAVEQRELSQLRAGTHTVVPKVDLRVGRFQHFQNGERTWRFDTATGATCILLTSDLDWQNEKTKSNACVTAP
jgi:hypothetical protein